MDDLVGAARRAAKEERARLVEVQALKTRRERVVKALSECERPTAPSDLDWFRKRRDGNSLFLEFRWQGSRWPGMGQFTPLSARWPEANKAYCRYWVELWDELILAMQESGDVATLGTLRPTDLDNEAMHELLLSRVAGGKPDGAVTEALAFLREGKEPDMEELKDAEQVIVGYRERLGNYFAWLRGELKRAWDHADDLAASEDQVGLANIPPLDTQSVDWVRSRIASQAQNVSTATLANYRLKGRKSADGLLGIDPKGRIWRKANPNAQAWYLRPSLAPSRGA